MPIFFMIEKAFFADGENLVTDGVLQSLCRGLRRSSNDLSWKFILLVCLFINL